MRNPSHGLPVSSVDWLEATLASGGKKVPKVVVITNPNNPTGTYVPEALLKVRHTLRATVWVLLLSVLTALT